MRLDTIYSIGQLEKSMLVLAYSPFRNTLDDDIEMSFPRSYNI
jgi:hypothetical protein